MPAKSLQDLVDFARTHSPFYAELYRDVPEHVEHLSQLPVIDAGAFADANTWPDNRVLTGPLTDAGVYKTGGTTGAPKFSPWTRTEHADSVSAFGAGMVRAGLKPGHRVANLFRAGELYGGFLYIEGALHHAPVDNVRLPVGPASTEYIADLIAHFGVNVLAGEPMKLSAVAECVVDRGQATDSVELVLFAGDILFDDLRPILTRAFPKAAIASLGYASVDAGLVATPAPGDDVRVHEAVPNRTVVELVDEATGEPIGTPGVAGRVVVTNLFRTLMPIIRYPVGDRAEWADPECRQFRLLGRADEGPRVGGVTTLPIEELRAVLIAADSDRHIAGMQVVQRRWDGRDGLVLRMAHVGEPPTDLADRLVQAVYAWRPAYPKEVAAGRAHDLSVEWVRRDELVTHPRTGKLVQVVEERPVS